LQDNADHTVFFAITEFISVFPGGLCQVERITVLSDYYVHRWQRWRFEQIW